MRVVLWIFAVIGALSVLGIALLVYGALHLQSLATRPAQIADSTVLSIDLDRPISESGRSSVESFLSDGETLSFATLLTVLQRAGADGRVKGVVMRLGSTGLGYAQVQELRDALKAFRAKGKFAAAFGESFGELDGGTRAYYLANAFDEIWLQPGGGLGLVGIRSELPLFKGSLDKLGIAAEFGRRGEYKTGGLQFTATSLPDSDREALSAVLGSIYDQVAAGIAEGRKLDSGEAKRLIDGGPYIAPDALAQHLIDHIGYRDEAEAAALKQAGAGTRLLGGSAYYSATNIAETGGEIIAVIRGVGEIRSGKSPSNPFEDNDGIGADTMVRALNEAAKDPAVKAIVLRIDSPGGSSVASETIWHAVKRAREAGRPVIVSMSNVAGSGGYYIAACADKIVAEPATITGSIGVYGGKFVIAGLWDKLGVNWASVGFGQNAGIGSSLTGFDAAQRQRFDLMLDDTYKQFVARVADGRKLDPVKVDAIARGRIWTGSQAKENGLVDEIGGFDVALKLAKEAAKLAPDQKIVLRLYPRPDTPLEQITQGLLGGGLAVSESATLLHHLSTLAPLLTELDALAGAHASDTRMRPMELAD